MQPHQCGETGLSFCPDGGRLVPRTQNVLLISSYDPSHQTSRFGCLKVRRSFVNDVPLNFIRVIGPGTLNFQFATFGEKGRKKVLEGRVRLLVCPEGDRLVPRTQN